MNNFVRDLHLLLIYLTGWEEEDQDEPDEKIFKAWKGYLFEVLDELEALKLIRQTGSTKLLLLTEAGKRQAQRLQGKYFRP